MNLQVAGLAAAADPLRERLVGFWRWWRGELLGMLPSGLRRALRHESARLILEVSAGRGELSLVDGEGVQDLGRVALGVDSELRRLAGAVRVAYLPRIDHLILRLDPREVLHRRITLPLAAEENLREVLGFEMDRYTPFTCDQVYYDHVIAGRDPEHGTLHVELLAVPRRHLGEVIKRLGEAGLAPSIMDVAPQEAGWSPGFNLLPQEQRGQYVRPNTRWYRLGVALLIVLTALAVGIPLVQKQRMIHGLERAVDQAREAAQAVYDQRKTLDELLARSRYLSHQKTHRAAVIDVLEVLTRLLPDDTWLDRFELRGGQIKIQGESKAASSLIPLIEAAPLFRNVSFAAPVTHNVRTAKERFVITAQLPEPTGE